MVLVIAAGCTSQASTSERDAVVACDQDWSFGAPITPECQAPCESHNALDSSVTCVATDPFDGETERCGGPDNPLSGDWNGWSGCCVNHADAGIVSFALCNGQ